MVEKMKTYTTFEDLKAGVHLPQKATSKKVASPHIKKPIVDRVQKRTHEQTKAAADKLMSAVADALLEKSISKFTTKFNKTVSERFPNASQYEKDTILSKLIKEIENEFNTKDDLIDHSNRLIEKGVGELMLLGKEKGGTSKESVILKELPMSHDKPTLREAQAGTSSKKNVSKSVGEEIPFEDVPRIEKKNDEKVTKPKVSPTRESRRPKSPELTKEDKELIEHVESYYEKCEQKLLKKTKNEEVNKRNERDLQEFNQSPYLWIRMELENTIRDNTDRIRTSKNKTEQEELKTTNDGLRTELTTIKHAFDRNLPLKLHREFTPKEIILPNGSTLNVETYAKDINTEVRGGDTQYTIVGVVQRYHADYIVLQTKAGNTVELDMNIASRILLDHARKNVIKQKILIEEIATTIATLQKKEQELLLALAQYA